MKDRVGIFGGSFDPVHWGHIKPVLSALKFFNLSCVIYLPASKPPHKENLKMEDPFHRMAMLSIALLPYKNLLISTHDLINPLSKTLNSLLYFKEKINGNLYFILGSDSLLDFKNWYKPEEILKFANLIVLKRPEFEIERIIKFLPDFIKSNLGKKIFTFQHPAYGISGTLIRDSLRRGENVEGLLPKRVINYIIKNKLYKEG